MWTLRHIFLFFPHQPFSWALVTSKNLPQGGVVPASGIPPHVVKAPANQVCRHKQLLVANLLLGSLIDKVKTLNISLFILITIDMYSLTGS